MSDFSARATLVVLWGSRGITVFTYFYRQILGEITTWCDFLSLLLRNLFYSWVFFLHPFWGWGREQYCTAHGTKTQEVWGGEWRGLKHNINPRSRRFFFRFPLYLFNPRFFYRLYISSLLCVHLVPLTKVLIPIPFGCYAIGCPNAASAYLHQLLVKAGDSIG